MRNRVLVIGGTPAGFQAAGNLADAGVKVHLVESRPFLGRELYVDAQWHRFDVTALEILKHPNIRVHTNTCIEKIETTSSTFLATFKHRPRFVDLDKCTGCGDCMDVCPVDVLSTGTKAVYLPEGAQPGCAAVIKDGKSPCAAACPAGIDVQGYVALTAAGRFQEAIDLIRRAIPFPGIMGRICTHPCESGCRRSELDVSVSIRRLKRFLADWESEHGNPPDSDTVPTIKANKEKRVAIVGAGPAGMTAADRLASHGHSVTVFDKLPVAGGMLAVGIPEYRLPREILRNEYSRIEALGVELILNTAIGPGGEYTVQDLFEQGFDAVCLTIGAHRSISPGISGEDLPGVVHGIAFLKAVSLEQQIGDPESRRRLEKWLEKGEETRAVVIGGGNTAMDVARSMRRLGVKSVRIVYRRTQREMPAMPEEIEDADKEGIDFDFLTAPIAIRGNRENGVRLLECIRMKLAETDDSGRRRPVPVEGSEFAIPVDLVMLAIGQEPAVEDLGGIDSLEITRHQRIKVDENGIVAGCPGLFAAGDAVTRSHMSAVEAIGMGKKVAAAIDAWLTGNPVISTGSESWVVSERELSDAERRYMTPLSVPMVPVETRCEGFMEVEGAYPSAQATKEAGRCLACGPCSECRACENVCSAGAVDQLQYKHSESSEFHAIIRTEETTEDENPMDSPGIFSTQSDSELSGSAAAGRCLAHLRPASTISRRWPDFHVESGPSRIGITLCQCGGVISKTIDLALLREKISFLDRVEHTEILPFSCCEEGVAQIREMIGAFRLNRLVVAACACCSLDQICYACTWQRVRCKALLGIFGSDNRLSAPLAPEAVEFVNIREHCAFIYGDSPNSALESARLFIGAAATRLSVPHPPTPVIVSPGRAVAVVGGGRQAMYCMDLCQQQGFEVFRVPEPPSGLYRQGGQYVISVNGDALAADAVITVPADDRESKELLNAIELARTGQLAASGQEGERRLPPGIFDCPPGAFSLEAVEASAAGVAAWLGRSAAKNAVFIPRVDARRCRACGTCAEICEIGAPFIVEEDNQRHCRIDPIICSGCGACVSQCPSDAIRGGIFAEDRIKATIDTLLRD